MSQIKFKENLDIISMTPYRHTWFLYRYNLSNRIWTRNICGTIKYHDLVIKLYKRDYSSCFLNPDWNFRVRIQRFALADPVRKFPFGSLIDALESFPIGLGLYQTRPKKYQIGEDLSITIDNTARTWSLRVHMYVEAIPCRLQ